MVRHMAGNTAIEPGDSGSAVVVRDFSATKRVVERPRIHGHTSNASTVAGHDFLLEWS